MMNIFKGLEHVIVHEGRLIYLLRLLDKLGIKIKTIKCLNGEFAGKWYISVWVNAQEWFILKDLLGEFEQFDFTIEFE